MTRWKEEIDIKQHLGADKPLDEVFAGIRDELARLTRESVPNTIIEVFEEAVDVNDVEAFNEALDFLYDWADARRIWLG